MKKKQWLWLLFLVLLVMVGGVVWLAIRLAVPVNPKQGYFPEDYGRLGDMKSNVGVFQPVYLYAYMKGNAGYIRAAYRDRLNKINIIDIYLGEKLEGKSFVGVINLPNDTTARITAITQYGKYFKLGQRINIQYLRSMYDKNEIYDQQYLDMKDEWTQKYCRIDIHICDAYKQVEAEPDKYWNFRLTQTMPGNIILTAIHLSPVLTK